MGRWKHWSLLSAIGLSKNGGGAGESSSPSPWYGPCRVFMVMGAHGAAFLGLRGGDIFLF